jgi:hypothetical protein
MMRPVYCILFQKFNRLLIFYSEIEGEGSVGMMVNNYPTKQKLEEYSSVIENFLKGYYHIVAVFQGRTKLRFLLCVRSTPVFKSDTNLNPTILLSVVFAFRRIRM